MGLNFNDADAQKGPNTLIPDGTKAKVNIKVRPGGSGEGGWLTQSKSSANLMLDLEFTVIDGPSAKRKFWELMVVEGSEEAVNISRSRLRALLESARGIKSNDQSDAAKQKRQVNGYSEFDGLEPFVAIRIEKSKDPQYQDKNKMSYAITPDHKDWIIGGNGAFNQVVGAGVSNAQPKPSGSGKPSWAQ